MTVRIADARYTRIVDPTTRTVVEAHEQRVSALERPDFALSAPTFTIGAESTGANRVMVRVQLRYPDGAPIDFAAVARCYLSDAQGGTRTAGAPDTTVTVPTGHGTQLLEETTRAAWTVETAADGHFDLDIVHTAAATWFLSLLWYGRKFASGPITFA